MTVLIKSDIKDCLGGHGTSKTVREAMGPQRQCWDLKDSAGTSKTVLGGHVPGRVAMYRAGWPCTGQGGVPYIPPGYPSIPHSRCPSLLSCCTAPVRGLPRHLTERSNDSYSRPINRHSVEYSGFKESHLRSRNAKTGLKPPK